jgi:hypothetical protein
MIGGCRRWSMLGGWRVAALVALTRELESSRKWRKEAKIEKERESWLEKGRTRLQG